MNLRSALKWRDQCSNPWQTHTKEEDSMRMKGLFVGKPLWCLVGEEVKHENLQFGINHVYKG